MKDSRPLKHIIITHFNFFSWNTNKKDERQSEGMVGKWFQSGIEFQVVTTLPLLVHVISILNAMHMQEQWMKCCVKWTHEKQMTLGEGKKPPVTHHASQEINPEKSSCYGCYGLCLHLFLINISINNKWPAYKNLAQTNEKMWTTDWCILVSVGICLGTQSTFISPEQFIGPKIQFENRHPYATASHLSLFYRLLRWMGWMICCSVEANSTHQKGKFWKWRDSTSD